MGGPIDDWFVEVKVGALAGGEFQMSVDGGFGQQVTGGGFIDGDIVGAGLEGGKAAANFVGIQQLMGELMLGCT